jgi:four helix bundle protein
MGATTFQDLEVRQKAHAWVLGVYRLTACFPRGELFGLTSQLRRAATSVPANISEGFVKRGKADKLRFYNIAQGSLEECRYYLILARDLGYADTADLMTLIDEVSRMLEGYTRAIASERRGGRFFSLFWLLASGFWLLPSRLLSSQS